MPKKNHNRERLTPAVGESVENYELSPEEDARASAAIAASDTEHIACNVNFRWGKHQVSLIKAVADEIGIPYQTYIKQVLYRQALADLEMLRKSADRSSTFTIVHPEYRFKHK